MTKDVKEVNEKVKELAKQKAKGARNVLQGFRDFALRGNAMELAIGVVIGGAFTALVNAIVNSVLNPLVAAVFGKSDMANIWELTINGSAIKFGAVAAALINFVIIAAALYFFIILPINKLSKVTENLTDKSDEDNALPEREPETKEEELLRDIRDLLKEQQPNKAFK